MISYVTSLHFDEIYDLFSNNLLQVEVDEKTIIFNTVEHASLLLYISLDTHNIVMLSTCCESTFSIQYDTFRITLFDSI